MMHAAEIVRCQRCSLANKCWNCLQMFLERWLVHPWLTFCVRTHDSSTTQIHFKWQAANIYYTRDKHLPSLYISSRRWHGYVASGSKQNQTSQQRNFTKASREGCFWPKSNSHRNNFLNETFYNLLFNLNLN